MTDEEVAISLYTIPPQRKRISTLYESMSDQIWRLNRGCVKRVTNQGGEIAVAITQELVLTTAYTIRLQVASPIRGYCVRCREVK